jgi:oligoribonuclease NrnB/cAMP/cGMP phosphodiesterase (DHH superfamily)
MFNLHEIKKIFFHSNCADGTAAALICARALKTIELKPEFHPVQYDTNFFNKICPEPGHLFLDITPPQCNWQAWKDMNPIVLDHHESVKNIVISLGGVYGDEINSGATLAFNYIFMPLTKNIDDIEKLQYERFANLAMIRDTWKENHPDWKESQELSHGLNFFGSDKLLSSFYDDKLNIQEILHFGKYQFEAAERKARLVTKSSLYSYVYTPSNIIRIAMFNCTDKIYSEVSHVLLNSGVDVAIGYFYLYEDGITNCVVTIRTSAKINASKLAEKFSGGGRSRTAGFKIKDAGSLSPNDLYDKIISVL